MKKFLFPPTSENASQNQQTRRPNSPLQALRKKNLCTAMHKSNAVNIVSTKQESCFSLLLKAETNFAAIPSNERGISTVH